MKEGRNALIVFNPTAGPREKSEHVRVVQERLQSEHRWKVNLVATQHANHAKELALCAQEKDVEVIIVAGGDGTLNNVVQACAGTEMLVSPLGGGTENLISTEVKMPRSPKEAADVIANGVIRQADVPEINGHKFIAVAGIGYDADMIKKLHKSEGGKKRRGRGGYIGAITESLLTAESIPLHVTVDGKQAKKNASQVFVQNSRKLAKFKLRSEGKIDDGLLEVTSLQHLLPRGGALLAGGSFAYHLLFRHQAPFMQYQQGREIKLESEKPISYQVDGDPVGESDVITVTLNNERNRINLWVPDKEIEIFSRDKIS